MKNDLDVWAIQYYPKKLNTALSKIDSGINIIYSNVMSCLELNDKEIVGRYFNTVLYNEDSKLLIMLMSGCRVNKYSFINYLEENKKDYVEVNFMINKQNTNNDSMSEFLFVKDNNVLEDVISSIVSKGLQYCIVYPSLFGSFDLSFRNNDHEKIKFIKLDINGLIKFKDKIVLLLNDDIDYISLLQKYNVEIFRSYKNPNIDKSHKPKTLKKTYKD